jgi:hypothetical protein
LVKDWLQFRRSEKLHGQASFLNFGDASDGQTIVKAKARLIGNHHLSRLRRELMLREFRNSWVRRFGGRFPPFPPPIPRGYLSPKFKMHIPKLSTSEIHSKTQTVIGIRANPIIDRNLKFSNMRQISMPEVPRQSICIGPAANNPDNEQANAEKYSHDSQKGVEQLSRFHVANSTCGD